MIALTKLTHYLEALLEPKQFQDYCHNGLQVEGKEQINTLVTGVTASKALINAALDVGADTILVHHGYFWQGEDPRIIGIKQQRLKPLLLNNVNLIAYHLPLDAHTSLGNNAQLSKLLGFEFNGCIPDTGEPLLAMYGCLAKPHSCNELTNYLEYKLKRRPLAIQAHTRPITKIGWCTGAAQKYISQAAELGLDAFLSGEISESTVHLARELGINYFAAGHHATERYGVLALGEHLKQKFDLQHQFIDIDNPA